MSENGIMSMPMEVYNHLHPSIATWTLLSKIIHMITPIDYNPSMELDKSFGILKGGKLVGVHECRLINIVHDFDVKNSPKEIH